MRRNAKANLFFRIGEKMRDFWPEGITEIVRTTGTPELKMVTAKNGLWGKVGESGWVLLASSEEMELTAKGDAKALMAHILHERVERMHEEAFVDRLCAEAGTKAND
jgi:hypothetical protein